MNRYLIGCLAAIFLTVIAAAAAAVIYVSSGFGDWVIR